MGAYTMSGRTVARNLSKVVFAVIAYCGFTSAASALPKDPCNVKPQPAMIGAGSMSIAPVEKQTPRKWQRKGGNIEITVKAPTLPPKATILVCFEWKLLDPSAPFDEKYKRFVPSDSVTASIPADKPSGRLTITASVPTNLPDTPVSPRVDSKGRPVGVYGQNNQYPLADVRVLLFGDGNDPVVDLTSAFGIIGADVYCDMPLTGTNADSGIGTLGEHRKWQPVGGEFEFTVKSNKVIPANAPVLVCFRWKLEQGDPKQFYDSGPTHIVDRQPQTIKVAATVLQIPDEPTWWPAWWPTKGQPSNLRISDFAIPVVDLVPLVDARILILDNDGVPIVDVLTTVGITNVFFALVITVLVLAFVFISLGHVCRARLEYLPKRKRLLNIITTRSGYASLSQFQIVLWTFVVLASAAYVMSLSGDLIPISTGTLVLLGISGSATIIAKAKSESDAAAPRPAPDPAAAAAAADAAEKDAQKLRNATSPDADAIAEADAKAAAARAKAVAADAVAAATKKRAAVALAAADQKQAAENEATAAENNAQQMLKAAAIATEAAKRATRQRHPLWSDLVMEETQGRELDVTRVQMLYFTLVTAAFVLLKVITSYEIPVIPEGFLLLMGISNSVYVGSKFANKPAAG
jgi:hypothetical protein